MSFDRVDVNNPKDSIEELIIEFVQSFKEIMMANLKLNEAKIEISEVFQIMSASTIFFMIDTLKHLIDNLNSRDKKNMVIDDTEKIINIYLKEIREKI